MYKPFLIPLLWLFILTSPAYPKQAREILSDAGVTGGLLVHLGCGEGELTADLYANERFLVHGLDSDPGNVAKARKHIQSRGLYGKVSVDLLKGPALPYADNLVNLLVVQKPGEVPRSECMRVLAPKGVLYLKSQSGWEKTVKPWSEDIDEWTHHLHGPGCNPVADDRKVGPPRHIQWKAGPRWARSHGWTPSVSAMVSAGGRLFYICDETPAGMDGTVPGKWFLEARDALSGVLLWKHPINRWGSEEFSGTPDRGGKGITGRFTMPPNTGKRLVAVGNTVYATLGPDVPVTALNAATGEVKEVYEDTDNAGEFLCTGRCLVASINPSKKPFEGPAEKQICTVDTKTGKTLWKKGAFPGFRTTKMQDPFGRLELAAGDGKVFLLTTKSIECLELQTGDKVWRIDRPKLPEDAVTKMGFSGMYEYNLTTMVYEDGTLLLAQPEPNIHHTYHTMPGTLYAFDGKNGKKLWEHSYGGWGHQTQPGVFVVNGTAWTHVNADAEFGRCWGGGYRAKNPSKVDYRIQGLDLRTGDLKEEISTKLIFNVGHHHRCARNKITERFLMSARRGVEFVDLSTGENYQNHWVRSGCFVGYLPCNGLLYTAPHPCSCYIKAKLTGFNALAPAAGPEPGEKTLPSERLLKGPAYGKVKEEPSSSPRTGEWPTYRHDTMRSGATDEKIQPDLALAWKSRVGDSPTAPVVAGGKVFAAASGEHQVCALDAENGKLLWRFTAGGPVHSPPTIYKGLAIFGSADGRVYCLKASDGKLVWRFEAAPRRRLVTDCGQLESAWPVPGSVLIHNGMCYFAAGRSSYLDGGIRFYKLDPFTGKTVKSDTIYSPDPETGKMKPTTNAHRMEGLLNDIPATDVRGTGIYIRQRKMVSGKGPSGRHLYMTGGYLDSSWFNRTFWKFGKAQTTGLMVLGKGNAVFGMEVYPSRGRDTVFRPGANQYRLMRIPRRGPKNRRGRTKGWRKRLGIRVTAMLRAGDTIFAAGSPDIVDPKDPHGAWEGRKGGLIAAVSTGEGKKLSEYRLEKPPAWDSMAAAAGRLYLSLSDGSLVCIKGKE